MDQTIQTARDRLEQGDRTLTAFKNKVHKLRTIVLGDPTALFNSGASQDQDQYDEKRAHATKWPDLLVTSVEEGRSNKLLHAVRTLGQQTAYQFPEIEAEYLEYEEANLHAEYFRQRLGPRPLGCDAVVHMRRALYDYLTGGFGWVWIGMQRGKPVIRYVDTIDCKWDQSASTISEGRWWSTTMYGSLGQWAAMYGKDKFAKYQSLKNATDDTPVELEYYYSLEGPEGAWLVMFKTGVAEIDDSPVFKSVNPCYWDYGGQRVPFLPSECMFFMELPSARFPQSLAEQMLAHQIALWRVEKTIRETVDSPGFTEYEEGSIDPKELREFQEGKTGGFLKRAKGSSPLIQNPALAIPASNLQWRQYHEQEITAMAGANPYASGAPVEGTSYAAEVNAINAASGLMAGTIAKENADFWLRMLRKFLAKGAGFDEWPLVVRHEDVTLVFDESDPVRQYLRPDTKLTIREDSMQFVDQQTKIRLAAADLDAALKVQQIFPATVKEQYENYLRARGEKNVDKHFEAPAQQAPVVPVTAPV